jgi:hypothetical protein
MRPTHWYTTIVVILAVIASFTLHHAALAAPSGSGIHTANVMEAPRHGPQLSPADDCPAGHCAPDADFSCCATGQCFAAPIPEVAVRFSTFLSLPEALPAAVSRSVLPRRHERPPPLA